MPYTRDQLDRLAERLSAANTDRDIVTYIVGPEYPKRLYELRKEYNLHKGDVPAYIALPMEELKVYAVRTSSPTIVEVQFDLEEITTLGLKYSQ